MIDRRTQVCTRKIKTYGSLVGTSVGINDGCNVLNREANGGATRGGSAVIDRSGLDKKFEQTSYGNNVGSAIGVSVGFKVGDKDGVRVLSALRNQVRQ